MKNKLISGALAILSLASLPVARAAYNPGIVGPDARWVVYADINALRESVIGREVVAAIAQAQADVANSPVKIDVPRLISTFGSITAYGSNLVANPELLDGTLIAEGTPDLRKITESLLLQGTIAQADMFTEVKDLPFPAYAIGEASAGSSRQPMLLVAFPPEPIIIASRSKAQILKAREAFRGRDAAKTNGNAFARLANVADGAFLFAATDLTSNPGFPQNSTEARLLQMTKSGALALGESGPNTFARVQLVATSSSDAEKMAKILEGLTAMLSFAETNDKALGDFLKATSVAQEKERVTLSLAYPSARLVEMAKVVQLQMEGKPRNPAPSPQQASLTLGKSLAEWSAGGSATPPVEADADGVYWRTVENVALVNGSRLAVGRAANGDRLAKIDRVEIAPSGAVSVPFVFRGEDISRVNGRNNLWQIPFPGVAGTYTVRVGYNASSDSKAKFALSVSEPKTADTNAAPTRPQPGKNR
jgi:hypothetical protein